MSKSFKKYLSMGLVIFAFVFVFAGSINTANAADQGLLNQLAVLQNMLKDLLGKFQATQMAALSATGSISITSPASGVTYKVGDSVAVKWNSADAPGTNTVYLRFYNSAGTELGGGGIPNNGTFSFGVPATMNGMSFLGQIRVAVFNYDKRNSPSDATLIFNVTDVSAPAIITPTVLSPNGGEVFRKGDTMTIRWNPNGSKNPYAGIWLFDSAGNSRVQVNSIAPNTGSFDWSIPATAYNRLDTYTVAPGQYKIGVSDVNNTGNNPFGYSAGLITINDVAPVVAPEVKPTIVSFNISHLLTQTTRSTSLVWTSNNTDTCNVSSPMNNYNENGGRTGSISTGDFPASGGTYNFTLVCKDSASGLTDTSVLTVSVPTAATVISPVSPTKPTIVSFNTSHLLTQTTRSTTLVWTSNNADSCNLSGYQNNYNGGRTGAVSTGDFPASGGSYNFTLVCKNNSSGLTDTSVLDVNVPAVASTDSALPVLSFSKKSFVFNYTIGGTVPPFQSLTYTSPKTIIVTQSLNNQPSWLNSGYNTDPMTLTAGSPMGMGALANPAGLSAGTYTTGVTLTGNFSGSPMYIPITLNVSGPSNQPSVAPSVAITGLPGNLLYVKLGDRFTISAAAQGIKGSSYYYGTGLPPAGYYNRAFFFDSNAITCDKNEGEWDLSCTAKTAGTSTFYVELYTNGQTYKSNVVTINVKAPAPSESLWVTAPTSSDTFRWGDRINVKWEVDSSMGGAPSYVYLYFYNSAGVELGGGAVPNTGAYSFGAESKMNGIPFLGQIKVGVFTNAKNKSYSSASGSFNVTDSTAQPTAACKKAGETYSPALNPFASCCSGLTKETILEPINPVTGYRMSGAGGVKCVAPVSAKDYIKALRPAQGDTLYFGDTTQIMWTYGTNLPIHENIDVFIYNPVNLSKYTLFRSLSATDVAKDVKMSNWTPSLQADYAKNNANGFVMRICVANTELCGDSGTFKIGEKGPVVAACKNAGDVWNTAWSPIGTKCCAGLTQKNLDDRSNVSCQPTPVTSCKKEGESVSGSPINCCAGLVAESYSGGSNPSMLGGWGATCVKPSPVGTYTVSQDNSSLYGFRAVRAGTEVSLAAFRFTAPSNETIIVKQVALQLSGTGKKPYENLVGYNVTLWDGATQVGSAIFMSSAGNATSTLSVPFVVSKGTTKTLVAKSTLVNQDLVTGVAGVALRVDYDGDNNGLNGNYGTGYESGMTVSPKSPDTNTAGVRVYANIPVFKVVSSGGIYQNMVDTYKFTVSNPSVKDLVLGQLTFAINTTGGTASGFTLYAGDVAVAAASDPKNGMLKISFDATNLGKIIPAGSSRTFTLKCASLTDAPNVNETLSISLKADYTQAPALMSSASALKSANNIVWSPVTTRVFHMVSDTLPVELIQHESDADWANGYGLPGFILGQDFPMQTWSRGDNEVSSVGSYSVSQPNESDPIVFKNTGNEDINLKQISLRQLAPVTSDTSGLKPYLPAYNDGIKVSIFDGSSKIGEVVFMSEYATATLPVSLKIQKNTQKTITLDPSNVTIRGVAAPAILVVYDENNNGLNGNYATGVNSGMTIKGPSDVERRACWPYACGALESPKDPAFEACKAKGYNGMDGNGNCIYKTCYVNGFEGVMDNGVCFYSSYKATEPVTPTIACIQEGGTYNPALSKPGTACCSGLVAETQTLAPGTSGRAPVKCISNYITAPVSSARLAAPAPIRSSLVCTDLSSDLRYGAEGADVTRLQNFLNASGYLTTDPTGTFGPLTMEAVKKFQGANGVASQTGGVGPLTRVQIKTASCR